MDHKLYHTAIHLALFDENATLGFPVGANWDEGSDPHDAEVLEQELELLYAFLPVPPSSGST